MDRNRATRLLTKWIAFNGMDREDRWEVAPGETPVWPRVQKIHGVLLKCHSKNER